MCTSKNDVRLEEIFNQLGTYNTKRSCTSGGCPPDVVVEFRASKSHYGKFGFDWLRVDDTDLKEKTPTHKYKKSDIRYTQNIGTHYTKKIKDGKYELDEKNKVKKGVVCSDDTEITTPVGTIFETDKVMQTAWINEFETLTKVTPMNKDDINTLDVDESLNDINPALKSDFRYVIPVITLMPKDQESIEEEDKKNPHNINLEALLDVNVYVGSVKPTALKLGFETVEDKNIFNAACEINKMNLFKESKKSQVKITSIGTLHKDITIYVYATNNIGGEYICGAFKVLRNNVVKDVTLHYIGTIVNADKSVLTAKIQEAPSIDMELRTILGQALINIKKEAEASLNLDMTGKLSWTTAMVKNPDFDLKKPIDPDKNPELIPKQGLDHDSIMPELELEYYNQYLRKKFTPHKPSVSSATKIYSGNNPDYIGKRVFTSEFLKIKSLFPSDIYRCYFLADEAVTKRYKTEAAGGGAKGDVRARFYGAEKVFVSTLAHELGHNLDLGHTFSQPSEHSYVYQYQSTDNVMDYVDGNTFYYGQWKIMKPEGIS